MMLEGIVAENLSRMQTKTAAAPHKFMVPQEKED